MLKNKIKFMPVMSKILLSHFILIFIILVFVNGYNVFKDISSLNETTESTITTLSNALSNNEEIINMTLNNNPNKQVIDYLDTLTNSIPKIDLIVIVNKDDTRLYHPDKDKIGRHFLGGDEDDILTGSDNYISETIGTSSKQIRSFSSIRDNENNVIGFVMVSAYSATLNDIKNQIILKACIFFLLTSFIGFILSYLLSRNIKNTLLGYEPTKLTQMYLEKKEVLNSLDEGIIAIDPHGQCMLYNNSAINMLKHSFVTDCPSELIDEFIYKHMISTLQEGNSEYNAELNINDITILVNKIPLINDKMTIGAVAILRDKTEVTKLAEELTGVNHIIEALRANTHEHMNKLHVILGLLQIGDTEKAIDYIGAVTDDHEKNYRMIMNKIKNRTIAALILGKINRSKELNIDFKLQSTSFLSSNNPFLSVNELVTILGNLLENAMDAVKNTDGPREVNLYIYNDDCALTIIVDDTGTGIKESDIDHIFTRGFSTKGRNRGIGLNLVDSILKKCDGTINVESDLNIGTSITIIINKNRSKMKG